MNRTQRRLIISAVSVILLVIAGWVAYNYQSNAPTRALAAYDDGMAAQATGNFELAVAKFTEALVTRDDANTYLQRGNAFANLGKMEQASDDWSRAIAINGQLAEAYTARGNYFRSKGDTSRALQDLEHSIGVSPTMEAYYQLGELYRAQKRFDIAIQTYSHAIDLMPTAPYIYLARAEAKRASGDEAGADEDLTRGLELQEEQ